MRQKMLVNTAINNLPKIKMLKQNTEVQTKTFIALLGSVSKPVNKFKC